MAAAILLFCFQGAGRKLSTECRSVAGSRPSWRPIAGKAMYLRYETPTFRVFTFSSGMDFLHGE